MVNRLADLFPIILLAGVASLVLAPLFVRLANALRFVDEPDSAPHKAHSVPTPLAGGPTISAAILAAYLTLRPHLTPEVWSIMIGGLILLGWGMVDDRVGLRPVWKLLGQLLVAGILLFAGIQVRFAEAPWINIGVTLIWYVGLINAFNFVDSMDGLALGLAAIASAFFMLVMIDSGQPGLALFSASILGACIGIYLYNASPARLFLGDSGAQLLGFLLAALGIAYVPGGAGLPQGVSWFTPILVLGVPIFDMILVVTSRLIHRQPIYVGNRDHTYHRLISVGMDPTRAVLVMQLAAIMLGLLAFIALDASVLLANALFFILCLAAALAGLYLLRAEEDVNVGNSVERVV